jgi:DNA-binding NtrC family response regulator
VDKVRATSEPADASYVILKEFRHKLAAAASQKVPESRSQWQSDTTVLVRADMIIAADLGFIEEIQATAPRRWIGDLSSAVAHFEEMPIRRALTRSCGNRAEAARSLGIHRQLLYTKIKRCGPDPCDQNSAN